MPCVIGLLDSTEIIIVHKPLDNVRTMHNLINFSDIFVLTKT